MSEMILYEQEDGSLLDDGGLTWTHFVVDPLAEQEEFFCSICDEVSDEGYLCMDGGEEVCWSCVLVWFNDGVDDPMERDAPF